MSQALKELKSIVTDNPKIPLELRQELMNQIDSWVYDWVSVLEGKTLVANTKYMDSEFRDVLLYNLGQNLSEQIIEDCTVITEKPNGIEAKGLIIRKKPHA
jgi:hypothetical protein